MADDLHAPLGMKEKRNWFRVPPAAGLGVAICLGAAMAAFAGWTFATNNPLGGEPIVTVNAGLADASTGGAIAATAMPRASGPGAEAEPAGPRASAAPDARPEPGPRYRSEQVVTIIDGKSGAVQEVKIAPGADAESAGNPLLEMTRNGPVPRIGQDGARAAQAYAQPFSPKSDAPRIAIVMAGLGMSASTTADAIVKLPGPITLAFSPYGSDVARVAAKARSLGHELLLQIPMEPFDYPENDPGPQTLVTSLPPEQNIDRLQWAMSRMQGYVGVVNQMGARFTASEPSLMAVMREIGKRGLLYLDDGSSPRSLAGQIAGGNSLMFVKTSVILDGVPSPAEIDRALLRLESAARENGVAVGFSGALPVTVDRIARWAKTAEARGFALTPITAAAARPKSG